MKKNYLLTLYLLSFSLNCSQKEISNQNLEHTIVELKANLQKNAEDLIKKEIKTNNFKEIRNIIKNNLSYFDNESDLLDNPVDELGNSLLHKAAEFKNLDFFIFLLNLKGNLEPINNQGTTIAELIEDNTTFKKVYELVLQSRQHNKNEKFILEKRSVTIQDESHAKYFRIKLGIRSIFYFFIFVNGVLILAYRMTH